MRKVTKKALSMVLLAAILLGFVPVPAAAATVVSVSTSMMDIAVRSDDKQVFKLEFGVHSPYGISVMSTVLSWDNTVIVPVDRRSSANYADFAVVHGGAFGLPLEVLLQDANGDYYARPANLGYTSGGRSAFQLDMSSTSPLTSMSEGVPAFAFYFRLADGKTQADLKKGTFRIETDKSPGSFLSTIYIDTALPNEYGLKVVDKAAGGDTTHFYSKSAGDTLGLSLVYPNSTVAQLGSVAISNDPKTVAVPIKTASPATLGLTAVGTDTEGDPYTFTGATTYSLVDEGGAAKAYTGVSINGSDLVVTNYASAGNIYVLAENEGVASAPTLFTVTKDVSALVATTVEVTPPAPPGSTLTVPTDDSTATATYTAKAYDQYGVEIPAGIGWRVYSAENADITGSLPTGMTFAAGTASVTKGYATAWAESDATTSFGVVAYTASIYDVEQLNVVRPASTAVSAKITSVDAVSQPAVTAATWIKPQSGSNTYTYYAYVTDQYGFDKAAEVYWDSDASPAHSKTYTVASTEEATSKTVTARYGAGPTATMTATIYPITPDWTTAVTVAASGVYGTANAGFVTVNSPGSLDVEVGGTSMTVTGAYAVVDAAGIQGAGQRSIVVSFTLSGDAGNGPYAGAVLTNSYLVSVNPKPITVAAVNASRYYGDLNPVFDFTFTPEDLVGGDTKDTLSAGLSLTSEASATTAAGSTVDITGIDTNANDNYAITVTKGTLTVDKALITVTGADIASKVYDGTTTIDAGNVTTVTFGGLKNSETLVLSSDFTVLAASYIDNPNIGTGKPASITVALAATPKAGNYTLTGGGVFAGATADITARKLTGTWSVTPRPYVYGDTTASVVFAPDNRVGAEDVGATGSAVYASPDAATGIAVTVSNISLTGVDQANYAAPDAPLALTGDITKAVYAGSLSGTKSVISSTFATEDRTYTFDLTSLLAGKTGFTGVSYAYSTYASADGLITTVPTVDGTTLSFVAKPVPATKTATITVTVMSGNYNDIAATVNVVSVDKTPVTIAGITAAGKTYDGLQYAYSGAASGTYNVSDVYAGTFEYSYTGTGSTVYSSADAPTDAGTYKLTVRVPDDNAEYTGAADYEFAIAAREVTVSGITAADKTYDGTTAATVNTSGAAFGGKVSGDVLSVSATGAFSDKNAGTGKTVNLGGLTLGGADAANYAVKADSQATTLASIARKPITVSAITLTDRIYDGTAAITAFSGAALSGVEAADAGKVSVGSITASVPDKSAGVARAVTFTAVTLAGDEAGNYVVTEMPTGHTVTITPKEVTVAGITAANRVYDGTTAATLGYGTASFAGKLTADTLTIATATGAFDDKHVGDSKNVSISGITLGGADAANYSVKADSQATATANITALGVTVSGITANNRVYNGTTAATLDYSGAAFATAVAGDDLSVASATGVFADKNAGVSKTVAISGITLGGTDAGNYTVKAGSQTSATATISRAEVTVSGITAADKVYDRGVAAVVNTTGASFGGLTAGDTLQVSTTGTFADKNVAAGKTVNLGTLYLGGASVGNYVLASVGQQTTATASITAKPVTVSGITAVNKKYDGTTAATLSYAGVTVTGKITGDALTVSATGAFADGAVGAGKPVAISAITLGGTDAGNYSVAAASQATTTASITKAEVTVSGITAANKPYDGTTVATLDTTGAVFAGKVGSDTLTVTASGAFADASAGTAKTVRISNLVLGGASAGNYALATVGQQAAATADITAKSIAITGATVAGKTYDGTTAAEVASVEFDVSGLVRGTDYAATAAFSSKAANASAPATVTITMLNTNYTLAVNTFAASAGIAQAGFESVLIPDQTVKAGSTSAALATKIGTVVAVGAGGETVTGTVTVTDDISVTAAYPAGSTRPVAVSFTHGDGNYISPVSGTAQVTFTELDPQAVAFTVSSASKTFGDPDFQYAATNSTVGGGAISYSSSDPAVATVAADGTVTIVGAGATTITATAAGVAGTYAETPANYLLAVAPKVVTVMPDAGQTKVYGASDPALNFTATPAIALTGALGREAGENAGTYGYTLGTLALGASDASNYRLLLDGTNTFVISKATYTGITFADATKGYSGAAQKIEVAGLPASGVSVSYTYKSAGTIIAATDVINAGTYDVTASFSVGPNYNPVGDLVATLTIAKVTPTLTLGNLSQTLLTNNITAVTAALTPSSKGLSATVEYEVDGIWTATIPQAIGSYSVRAYLPAGDMNLNAILADAVGMATGTLNITAYSAPPADSGQGTTETTTQNPDGSVTKTVTQTTQNVDGSTVTKVNETTTQRDTAGNVTGTTSVRSTTVTDPTSNIVIRTSEVTSTGPNSVSTTTVSTDAKLVQTPTVTGGTTSTTWVGSTSGAALVAAAKANETAASSGTTAPVASTITVDAKTGSGAVTSAKVELPVQLVQSIVTETSSALVVSTDVAQITFDRDALAGLAEAIAADEVIVVQADAVDDTVLSETQKEIVGDAPVYDLTAIAVQSSGESRVLSEFSGTVEVTVPYTLAAGEDPDNLSVYFINDAGELEKIACRYVDGHVVFTTNHFSYYAVVYESVAKFVDVTMADWYYDSVSRVVGAGLFRGTSETEFSPATKMSRAMVVTVIHRLDGETQVSGVNEFTDVPADTWYTDAVIWAAQNGIVDGYGDGRFGPGDDVTREQLAAILFRYVSFKGKGPTGLWAVELMYPDKALISDYAVEPAMWCQIHGIVTGFEDGSFAPQGLATRAEVATMLDRYMAKFVE